MRKLPPPQAPIRNKKRTRRNVLLLLTILFIVAGVAYTVLLVYGVKTS